MIKVWPFYCYRITTLCGFTTRFRLFAWAHERTCEVCTPVEEKGWIDLAVDKNGERYTSHTFADDGDPWRGATILTPSMVKRLEEEGLLPLIEVELSRDLTTDN